MYDHLQYWAIGNRFYLDYQTQLFYRTLIPLRAQSILIFIHGAGQHSGQFLDFGMYCWERQIALYAFDLRGFGQSTGKRGHIHSFDEYLHDLDKFVRHVLGRHPGIPTFLLGHSLGGTIVIRYGQEFKNCIQGAILSAPALKIRFHVPRYLHSTVQILSRLTPELYVTVPDLKRLAQIIPQFQHFPSGEISKEDPLSSVQYSARWVTELLLNGYQALTKVFDFRIPSLFICGFDDPLIDPFVVHDFYSHLPGKDKNYLLFHNIGHQLLHGPDKEPIYQHVVDWIRQHI